LDCYQEIGENEINCEDENLKNEFELNLKEEIAIRQGRKFQNLKLEVRSVL
jgi:hypothetical protein